MDNGAPQSFDHPLFTGKESLGFISADNPKYQSLAPVAEGSDAHTMLGQELVQRGVKATATHGKYEVPERSYIVENPSRELMMELAQKYGQESVVFSDKGKHELLYVNGPHAGHFNPATPDISVSDNAPPDYYTYIPGVGYTTINFEMDKFYPIRHEELGKSEYTIPEALQEIAKLIKGQLEAYNAWTPSVSNESVAQDPRLSEAGLRVEPIDIGRTHIHGPNGYYRYDKYPNQHWHNLLYFPKDGSRPLGVAMSGGVDNDITYLGFDRQYAKVHPVEAIIAHNKNYGSKPYFEMGLGGPQGDTMSKSEYTIPEALLVIASLIKNELKQVGFDYEELAKGTQQYRCPQCKKMRRKTSNYHEGGKEPLCEYCSGVKERPQKQPKEEKNKHPQPTPESMGLKTEKNETITNLTNLGFDMEELNKALLDLKKALEESSPAYSHSPKEESSAACEKCGKCHDLKKGCGGSIEKKEESTARTMLEGDGKTPGDTKSKNQTPKKDGNGALGKAQPPMAKPPTAPATPSAPPQSKPATAPSAPTMNKSVYNVKAEESMEKGIDIGTAKGAAMQQSFRDSSTANKPVAAPMKSPSGARNLATATKTPSGLELDTTSKTFAPGYNTPVVPHGESAQPLAMQPKPSGIGRPVAAPVGGQASPQAVARPGIFGRLFGKK